MDNVHDLREIVLEVLSHGRESLETIKEKFGAYFTAVGVLFVAYSSVKLTLFLASEVNVLVFGRTLAVDLVKQGKWAVVTGATDGIGKEYCRELAKRGLNVVLIARSPEKLEQVSKEIATTSSIATKCITVDFSRGPEIYNFIESQLHNINKDIGVLINNVGMGEPDCSSTSFATLKKQDCIDLVSVNLLSSIMMTRMILPGMIQRHRGVIVNLSSGMIFTDGTIKPLYYVTKSALDKFSKVLQKQNKNTGVTIQSVTPFLVRTNMTKRLAPFIGDTVFSLSPSQLVQYQLGTIGLQDETCGHFWHFVQSGLLHIIPSFVTNFLANRIWNKMAKKRKLESVKNVQGEKQ